jgi:hypothetical protein
MPGYNPNLRVVDGMPSLATEYAAERCGGSLSGCAPVLITVAADLLIEGNAALTQWRQALPGYPLALEQVSRFTAPGHPTQVLAIPMSPDYPDPRAFPNLGREVRCLLSVAAFQAQEACYGACPVYEPGAGRATTVSPGGG